MLNPTLRYVVRCSLTGVAAFCSSLLTALPGISQDDLIGALLLGTIFALGYAGIGAVSTNVEPNVGNKP